MSTCLLNILTKHTQEQQEQQQSNLEMHQQVTVTASILKLIFKTPIQKNTHSHAVKQHIHNQSVKRLTEALEHSLLFHSVRELL